MTFKFYRIYHYNKSHHLYTRRISPARGRYRADRSYILPSRRSWSPAGFNWSRYCFLCYCYGFFDLQLTQIKTLRIFFLFQHARKFYEEIIKLILCSPTESPSNNSVGHKYFVYPDSKWFWWMINKPHLRQKWFMCHENRVKKCRILERWVVKWVITLNWPWIYLSFLSSRYAHDGFAPP